MAPASPLPMILVLCNEHDVSAQWAAAALRRRGHKLRVVTDADLAGVERWSHSVGVAGAACEIQLAGGDVLRVGQTRGVLNRLSFLPAAWLRRYGGPDRDYAIQEQHALYLSWLHALPGPVLNPPTPQGLSGNWRHPSAWTALGVQAGLPVHEYRQTSDDDPALAWQARPVAARVRVVGARVVGPDNLVAAHHTACLQLSRSAGAPLLGIDFAPDPAGQWRMTGASVMPDLIGGGDPLVDALQEALLS